MWIIEKSQVLTLAELTDPGSAAVVVIDVQNDFCHPDGAFGKVGHDNSMMPKLAAQLRKLLAEARKQNVLTIFVRATYDREVNSAPLANHRRRLGLYESLCLEGTWGAEWYDGVGPTGAANEVVLTKHRFNAFKGTPLDLYLRSNGIRTVIVTGVVTAGCVESTVRDAFYQDYQVLVPRDGVAEADQDRHEQGLSIMSRGYAQISDVDQIVEAWRGLNAAKEPGWTEAARRKRAASDATKFGLVLVDADPQEAQTAMLIDAAGRACIPVFDVRSCDVPLGRTPLSPSDNRLPIHTATDIPGAHRVEKMRRSGFADTRLQLLLRTNGVRCLTIVGSPEQIAPTVFDALDADFTVSIPEPKGDAGGRLDLLANSGVKIAPVEKLLESWT